LWLRALGGRAVLAAATIALGWAAIDEVHQTGVQGRHGTPVDVLIDGIGITVAWLAWRAWHARRPAPPPPPPRVEGRLNQPHDG
jgi:VanZ family protein